MTSNVTLITPPDDIFNDALRVLFVDISHEQSQIVTDALAQLNDDVNIAVYVWTADQTVEWLIDKKHKSNLVIFNAESPNELIVGYMAAQHNAYYMGILRDLEITNNRAIKDVDTCASIFEGYIANYAKR